MDVAALTQRRSSAPNWSPPMNQTTIVLIVSLAVIGLVGVLLWRAQSRGIGSEARIQIAKLFDVQVQFTAADRSSALSSLDAAAAARHSPVADSLVDEVRQIADAPLWRVLWVDDRPQNNVHESVALEKLGFVITSVTSTSAALTYLDGVPYQLVISDLGRPESKDAGIELIEAICDRLPGTPVIIYTAHAARVRNRVLAAGARSVVDQPGDLVRDVLKMRSLAEASVVPA